MGGYIARRTLLTIPTLLGLSFLIFALASLAPGDPAYRRAARFAVGGDPTPEDVTMARHELRLDRPFLVQYRSWLAGALHADFGESFRGSRVWDEVRRAIPATFQLAASAFLFTLVLGIPLGVAAALLDGRWPDHVVRAASLISASIPGFFLAYVLVAVFAVHLDLLPVAGREGPASIVLPALVLAAGPTALVSRLLRSSLLEVLSEGYIATARAKGLGGTEAAISHGLPNAAIPVVTVLGGVLANLLEGAVVAEVIFAWPGLGWLAYNAITENDYPVVQATVVFAGFVFVTMNLLVDISYSIIDPRVRLGGKEMA